MKAIWERTLINCGLIWPAETQMRIWLKMMRRIDRTST